MRVACARACRKRVRCLESLSRQRISGRRLAQTTRRGAIGTRVTDSSAIGKSASRRLPVIAEHRIAPPAARQGAEVKNSIVQAFNAFASLVQKAGPYLLIEILLPGGTLIALALYMIQRQRDGRALPNPFEPFMQPFGIVASVSRGDYRERDGLEALAMAPVR
jgi:hypothetical protein